MRAFLEQVAKDWFDEFVYITKYQFELNGMTVIPFDGLNLPASLMKYDIDPKTDICIGSVEATNEFFKLCGVESPKSISYPKELKNYLGRNIIETTYGELGDDYPYFVKPAEDIKLFTGDTVLNDRHKRDLGSYGSCKDSTKVFKSEIVNFQSEYRVFASLGEIRGIRHYRGNPLILFDPSIITDMVNSYKDCPSAYTLDIGVTDKGETLLVEVNDMWAISSYGLEPKVYALLCHRRMREILNQK